MGEHINSSHLLAYCAINLESTHKTVKKVAKLLQIDLNKPVPIEKAAKIIKVLKLRMMTTRKKKGKIDIKEVGNSKTTIPHKYKSPDPKWVGRNIVIGGQDDEK